MDHWWWIKVVVRSLISSVPPKSSAEWLVHRTIHGVGVILWQRKIRVTYSRMHVSIRAKHSQPLTSQTLAPWWIHTALVQTPTSPACPWSAVSHTTNLDVPGWGYLEIPRYPYDRWTNPYKHVGVRIQVYGDLVRTTTGECLGVNAGHITSRQRHICEKQIWSHLSSMVGNKTICSLVDISQTKHTSGKKTNKTTGIINYHIMIVNNYQPPLNHQIRVVQH